MEAGEGVPLEGEENRRHPNAHSLGDLIEGGKMEEFSGMQG